MESAIIVNLVSIRYALSEILRFHISAFWLEIAYSRLFCGFWEYLSKLQSPKFLQKAPSCAKTRFSHYNA